LTLLRNPLVWVLGLFIGSIAWILYFGLGWMPNKLRYWFLKPFVAVAFQLWPGKKKQIKENLRAINPHWTEEELEKGAWENVSTLLWAWTTILNVRGSHRSDIRERMVGEEYLLELVNKGQKVVVVFPHIGNINELTSAVSALGIKAFVPAQAIPYLLFKLMAGSRAAAGNIEFMSIRRGKTLQKCAEKLEEGKVVIIAMDMPPSKKGNGYSLQVGRAETEVQVGAVKLALEENASLFMAQFHWGKNEPLIELTFFELDKYGNGELAVSINTRRLLHCYSSYLKTYATMWWRLPLIKMQAVTSSSVVDQVSRK
jgi:lauroyl/myristoyl acyltransferase